ncbi:hypothetical protein HG535_0B03590 [Zygotorulaspora mrakii]|uniref:Nuclear pore complex protein Nup85 n=1 Tax=Zygotorulaspora mrakii TaxID=42260 RepID=A0A7H9AY26_ZYGMR|nr:uncharacterized protein HG535_0B03590 [Zygotorulaspora mrakii]QLG71320.1 hypothetical protein HG535_0B03590 [Zygotorulaspora mrakii]
MTVEMNGKNDSLLMDVDGLDFVDEGQSIKDQLDDHEDNYIGRDSVSDCIVVSLSKGNEPWSYNKGGELHFKLSPLVQQNIAFLCEKDKYKIYPVALPGIDASEEYVNYVTQLFEIYSSLGEDRVNSVPTIGVVNINEAREHTMAANLAFEALVIELESFIDAIKNKKNAFGRFFEVEECLTIINCLKTIYFTADTPDEQTSRNTFIKTLLGWINRSDGEPNEEYIEQVFSSSSNKNVFETSFFWKLINQLLLRGLFEQAMACIERSELANYLSSKCQVSSNALHDIVALLKQYPLDSSKTFREWKSLVLELSQTYNDSETEISGEIRDYLQDTLLLIGGHQDKILFYSKTWYESFCGLLLFYIPSLELSEEYLQLSLKHNPLDVTNNWESACAEVIRGHLYSILPTLESLDSCTAAFTAALCEAKGLLENYNEDEDHEQSRIYREEEDLFSYRNGMAAYMLNNFAFEICSLGNATLWPVAIGLITLSPICNSSAKKLAIAELLPHYPFQSTDDIEWMLSVCAKWRLTQVAKSIYVTLGNKLLYESNTIEAMANYSKAGKFEWVKRYSWMMFEASVLQGGPLDDIILNAIVNNYDDPVIPKNVLDTLVTSAMKQSLSPYAVLYQFYVAQQNEKWSDALELLLLLLEFQYMPKCYVVLLVSKILLPIFLEDSEKVMKEDIILRIMECITNKWDNDDEKTQNIYLSLREMGLSVSENLDGLHKHVRKLLDFKLCQEYM